MIVAIMVALGLVLGSFVNALVFRLHMQSSGKKSKTRKIGGKKVDLSIARGRSVCVHCGHVLAWYDLIPVFSWLSLGGKCRYCRKPVSWQYPVVELITAALFVVSYLFWPLAEDPLTGVVSAVNFAAWLVIAAGFVALVVYDIKWMLLPNRIIYPLIAVAAVVAGINIVSSGDIGQLFATLLSVAIAGGVFYLIFVISNGKWIGGGDISLGVLIGLVLQDPYQAFLMLFLASVLGTLFVLPAMLLGKATAKSHIPFGPFLIAAAVLVFLFGPMVIDWYQEVILLQG